MLWYLSFSQGVAMSQTAKLFINGRSQAVRLPVAYRFDAKERKQAAQERDPFDGWQE